MKNIIKNKYNQHKETIHNFIWRAMQIGAKQGTTFIIFFIAAYFLIPEELGLFSYLMAVIGLLLIVCDFGFSPAASKYVAEEKTKDSKSLNNILFSISLIIVGMATVVSLFIIFAGKYIFEEYSLLLLLIPYLYFMPLSSVADGVYRGLKDFKKLSIISVVVAIIVLPISFFMIKSHGLIGAIISQNILFGLLTIGLFVFRRDMKMGFDKIVTKKIVKYALLVGIANIGFFFYTKVDILILKQFGFIAEIGYYEIVNKVFRLLLIPAVILGQVIGPNATKHITKGEYEKVRRRIFKLFPFFIVGGILISLAIYIILPIIIKNFLIEYYARTMTSIINIMVLVLPVKFVGSFLVNGFLVPTGHVRVLTISTAFFGILNIFFDILFIYLFGFKGVFYSTLLLSYFSFLIVFYIYTNKLKSQKK